MAAVDSIDFDRMDSANSLDTDNSVDDDDDADWARLASVSMVILT
jgi:hypothetical protein